MSRGTRVLNLYQMLKMPPQNSCNLNIKLKRHVFWDVYAPNLNKTTDTVELQAVQAAHISMLRI